MASAIERFTFFAGSWEGEETIDPSPWDREDDVMTGRLSFRPARDGVLAVEYAECRSGRHCYRASGVLAWDPQQGYRLWWSDSERGSRPLLAQGRWDGEQLTFSCDRPREWARFCLRVEGEDRMVFRRECPADGEPGAPIIEARFERTAATLPTQTELPFATELEELPPLLVVEPTVEPQPQPPAPEPR